MYRARGVGILMIGVENLNGIFFRPCGIRAGFFSWFEELEVFQGQNFAFARQGLTQNVFKIVLEGNYNIINLWPSKNKYKNKK